MHHSADHDQYTDQLIKKAASALSLQIFFSEWHGAEVSEEPVSLPDQDETDPADDNADDELPDCPVVVHILPSIAEKSLQ